MKFMKNVLVYVIGVFTFSSRYYFCEGSIHKIIQKVNFYLLFVSAIRSKLLNLTLESSVIHV